MKSREFAARWYMDLNGVLNDGGHIEGWNFEMYCLEAIKLRSYTTFAACLCQCTFKVSIVGI
jgi:hypothetical protein